MEIKRKYNVLVTGCGGDIGQSIGKILINEELFNKVIGADVNNEHAGIFLFDKFILLPKCNEANYLEALKEVVQDNEIDILIPTSEAELRFFSKSRLLDRYHGAIIITPSEEAMQIGFDKLYTTEFLKKHGLNYPQTRILGETSGIIYPSILKDREGAGSKSIFRLNDRCDYEYYKKKYPTYLVQEYLLPDEEEYTCGLFKSSSGEIRYVTFKRKLHGGATGYGVTFDDMEINKLLSSIAENIHLTGCINVQLRKTSRGPVVFEINPRFSSTVLFRHLLGFQDVIWSIQDKLNLPISQFLPVLPGRKIYRGYTEFIQ